MLSFTALIATAIALATLSAGVAAGDVTDNTQSALDLMTSLLLRRHAGAAVHRHTDRQTENLTNT